MCSHLHDEMLRQILEELKKVSWYYETLREDPIDEMLVLNLAPNFKLLGTKNRTRNMLFSTIAQQVVADMAGTGVLTINLQAGWNQTDFISGTKLYATTANTQVLYRCTNIALGGNVI